MPPETASNPYDVLIQECQHDTTRIQARYESHRTNRNSLQRSRLLSSDFRGVVIDPTLYKLVNKVEYPGYVDPRHCLVFWARPTEEIKKGVISQVQAKLREAAPNLWFMGPDNLHMTVLEITHSRQAEEISVRLEKLSPKLVTITDFTFDHRVRLIKPMLSFDASAFALSFVPAVEGDVADNSTYTYHHLRRDVWELCTNTGVEVDSRYVLPSAHLTLARFVSHEDTGTDSGDSPSVDRTKMEKLVAHIDQINEWLREYFWDNDATQTIGQWIVGQEKGLDCNRGTLWYGNGERIRLGKGF